MQANYGVGSSSISVVIPAYNAAATLEEALHSVLTQTVLPMEVIVVDDGSTDDTRSILSRFGGKIKTLHQQNSGLAASRRAGIEMAKGDFIALFDADDICASDRLALQLGYMNSCPEVLLTGTDFSAFNDQGNVRTSFSQSYYGAFKRYPRGIYDIFPLQEDIHLVQADASTVPIKTFRGPVYDKLVLGNFIHPPTIMFRRKVLDLVGNFDPAAGSMCDWDWIMQVARHGQIGYIARDLLRYRMSATQMSSERHRYRRAVDIIRILHRLRCRDPEIYQRYKREFQEKQGTYCLDAADAICEENRVASLRWLFLSLIRHRHFTGQSLRILTKVLMPSRLRDTVRQVLNKPAGV